MKNTSRQVRRQIERKGALPVPGFESVESMWLGKIIQRKMLELAVEMKGKSIKTLRALGLPTNVADAQEEAQRRAVRELPQERMVPNYRIKPCRNNSAKWRRSGVDTGSYTIAFQ